ncbi:huntingtin-interacting protein 1-related protein-like isoform X2 [Palaemon carinicauda]|uniref:huntingtin-interacting protein 1-related protein-like isoform X2 n=1 Tax=Palaemon carinicauda TaxID=392227 RepID=UPI0035B5FB7A
MSASIKRIPSVLTGTRRANTLDQEREQFERSQEASYRKAVNDEEVPVKMKHVRNLIIGTFTDKNSDVFWKNVSIQPPLSTDITAWKFLHTLHVIFRDGHPYVLRDAPPHIPQLNNIGQHFSHLAHGYGRLIKCYCDLLITKIKFHQRNPRIPGPLALTPEELEALAENDANNYFELAVEMLEYMECILNLYEVVFLSLDPSRANSMTRSGQCRLAPLIPCIQDSSCLYDCTVRILFQLHKALPTDMLSGHRARFYKQFKQLQQFYNNTRNLQYFKGLIQVPTLPQDPPNFLVEAELRSHVAPVVVVEEQPDIADTSDTLLIDTSEPEPPPIPPHPDIVDSHNGSLEEVVAERESLIDALHGELEAMRAEVQRVRSHATHNEEQFRLRINDLESTIAELDSELIAERQSKESVLAQVEAAAASAEAVTRLADEELKRRTAEEKFLKMKDVYQKLRDEHINLIRERAELDKLLAAERMALAASQRGKEELASNLNRLQSQMREESQMQQSSAESVQKEKESLCQQLAAATLEGDQIMGKVRELQSTVSQLHSQLEAQAQKSSAEMNDVKADWEAGVHKCIEGSVDGAKRVVDNALSHFDIEAHADVKCTPEYTLVYETLVTDSLSTLISSYENYLGNYKMAPYLITSLTTTAHFVAAFLLYAKATSHASPNIENAENLITALEEFSKECSDVLQRVRSKESTVGVPTLQGQFDRCCRLVSLCADQTHIEEDMASVVQREMETMDAAIRDAVEKFTILLENARATDSGMQLEVSESILGTCSDLMAAVRQLVQRASELQNEIVAAGKGGASPRDFYKRNHRWTEGLISGAKTVALACQTLMTAADQVVTGKGKFEEVIVASREIAASSMQLVMSSRVKADRTSVRLANLNSAAKTISTLTGTVVATAENCRDKVSTANTLDFSKLSLHSAKRLEMETLVKMLETEKQLENERKKLAALRKHHYQLAGELEGWEEVDIPK